MEYYVGLDVSMASTSICILDERGERAWRGASASDPNVIAATVNQRVSQATRIGLETGPLSVFLTHALRDLGMQVVCLEARHAKAALAAQLNKTDANDAEGLAHILRTGWYREVSVKSFTTHLVRGVISARAQLVNMRTELGNQIRGLLKIFGVIVGAANGKKFANKVTELVQGAPQLEELIAPLLASLKTIVDQVDALTKRLYELAGNSDVCRRLMSVPGVGPITALTFMTAIEDPLRFKKSRSVGAHLGLTPRRYQSGEVDRMGKISKCGDKLVRYYLFEAANVLLTRVGRWSALKAWGMQLARKVGAKKAKVAIARKLAVILHRIWVDSSSFRWTKAEASA